MATTPVYAFRYPAPSDVVKISPETNDADLALDVEAKIVLMDAYAPIYHVLTGDVVWTNSTAPSTAGNTSGTLADLSLTLAANTVYQVELHIGATSSATGHGVALAYAVTGTVVLSAGLRHGNGPSTAGTTQSTSTSMHAYLYNALGAVNYGTDTAAIGSGVSGIVEYLTVTGGASGGTLQLQAAQATGGAATTTTIKAGSWIVARKVA